MIDKISKGILIAILSLAVLLGAYLGSQRFLIESQEKNVSLCVDLSDLRKIAAYEKVSLDSVLKQVRKIGIDAIGVLEETLPDAAAQGELYYAKGSGLLRIGSGFPQFNSLVKHNLIKPERTYIYIPSAATRQRIYNQLSWVVGENRVRFFGENILEVKEIEEELRPLGLGISEIQERYLRGLGFQIIPRVWNDPRYHLGNIAEKIKALHEFDTIVFDGEEILGYPDAIKALASAMKKEKLRYGYVEIVKQDGDAKLRRLMGAAVVRTNSVPKDELKKLEKDEVVARFIRACRERKIKLIYLRPFLPPQVVAYPAAYNIKFFGEVKAGLEKAGFIIGKPATPVEFRPANWHLIILGLGVIIGMVFLLDKFTALNAWLMWLAVIAGSGGLFLLISGGQALLAQKFLAWLAAITFPAQAVINAFSQRLKNTFSTWDLTFIILNIAAETVIGIFLVIGLLADYRFMLGVETFAGVKFALLLPVLLVALYFILKQGAGGIRERIKDLLKMEINLGLILGGFFVLGSLAVFLARSGNFMIPVPGVEKYFRNFLETILFIRPRTKEFLIGYPLLYLAAYYYLRGQTKWLWLLAAIGVIGPLSLLNTFSHIHTPLIVSAIRSMNGLVLGVVIGSMVVWGVKLFKK
ncbi:hypothetical protein HZB07_01745 [Candidatus Saganbacteria bacterium]|nr:hypothetical protein [Candidatus Saganbacteria bacterium]